MTHDYIYWITRGRVGGQNMAYLVGNQRWKLDITTDEISVFIGRWGGRIMCFWRGRFGLLWVGKNGWDELRVLCICRWGEGRGLLVGGLHADLCGEVYDLGWRAVGVVGRDDRCCCVFLWTYETSNCCEIWRICVPADENHYCPVVGNRHLIGIFTGWATCFFNTDSPQHIDY